MEEIIKVLHSNLSIGEKRKIANIQADANSLLDDNAKDKLIVQLLQEKISLSNQVGILRKTLKQVCDKLDIHNNDFEKFYETVETIKKEVNDYGD